MNISLRVLWIVALCTSTTGVTSAQPPGASERVISPEVMPDNRVTFRLRAPEASEVLVNGNWPNGEGLAMSEGVDGIWSVTTEPLPPAIWSYTFSVDGLTLLDPANTPLRRNSLLVPGEETALYQPAEVPHGTVAEVWYPSPVTNADRRMLVYTPPGYEESNERYPVMYLYHGGGGNEENWSEIGFTQVIMDNLIHQKRIEPMNVGLKRLDQFAYVGQFSTGMFGGVAGYEPFDVEKISPGFLDDPAATNQKLELLYFSCGTDDVRMPFRMAAAEALDSGGIDLEFRSFPGDHEWSVWRHSLADFAGMIFR